MELLIGSNCTSEPCTHVHVHTYLYNCVHDVCTPLRYIEASYLLLIGEYLLFNHTLWELLLIESLQLYSGCLLLRESIDREYTVIHCLSSIESICWWRVYCYTVSTIERVLYCTYVSLYQSMFQFAPRKMLEKDRDICQLTRLSSCSDDEMVYRNTDARSSLSSTSSLPNSPAVSNYTA